MIIITSAFIELYNYGCNGHIVLVYSCPNHLYLSKKTKTVIILKDYNCLMSLLL